MKNSKRGFVGFLLLIVIVIIGLVLYVYFKNNHDTTQIKAESISFQNYSKDNFLPYTQLKYASLSYPKGWIVYPIKAGDNAADSVVMVPQSVSDKYQHSPNINLGISYFTVDNQKSFIKVGAEFQYSGYLSSSEQYKYLEDRVKRYQGFKNTIPVGYTSFVNSDAKIVTVKGIPMVYYFNELKQGNQTIKSVFYEWFVKPDSLGRDKSDAPVEIKVFYNSPVEEFSQETLNGVMDSINENFWENYFNSK